MTGKAYLSITLDAELFWLGLDPSSVDRPKTLSIGRYAITRGVDRIRRVLDERGVRATWFVPGDIARRYPETLARLAADGHEIGSRAHTAGALAGKAYETQLAEIRAGIDAVTEVSGFTPSGFRAPIGEVDADTFRALAAAGVAWSSSLHTAEEPRTVFVDGRPTVLDIGTRWELTDYVYFQFNYHPAFPAGQSRISSYREVLDEWVGDARATTTLDLPCVFSLTADVIGKPGRSLLLRRLLDTLDADGIRFGVLGDLAASAHRS